MQSAAGYLNALYAYLEAVELFLLGLAKAFAALHLQNPLQEH